MTAGRYGVPIRCVSMLRLPPHSMPSQSTAGLSASVSGTAPIGWDGKTVGVGDVTLQTRRCLEIIERALHDAGASLADVVRTRILLKNIDDWPAVAAVHGQCFSIIRPACTVCQIACFIDPQWLIEIEADAIVT